MLTYTEYVNAVHDKFGPDNVAEETDRAAIWIWATYIRPLQMDLIRSAEQVEVLESELKQAEERAEDANSGFNKGLDY